MGMRLTLEKTLGTLLSSLFSSGDNMQVPEHARKAVGALLKGRSRALMLYKDGDRLRWAAVYSNNFRDDDYPVREIISAQSHRNFAKLVELELAKAPDYWIWHESSLKIGTGEWVAVDEHDIDGNDIVFALAGGLIDEGREELAQALDVVPEKALSHGMPYWSVMYSDTEPDLILGHITTEVSWLPVAVAANKLTAGMTNVFKEMPSMINPEKLKELLNSGVSEELLNRLVSENEATGKMALDSKMQHKDVDTEEAEAETEDAADPVADAILGEATEDDEPLVEDTEDDETPKSAEVDPDMVMVSVKEIAELFEGVTTILADQSEKMTLLADKVKSLENEAAQTQLDNTPILSLAQLWNTKSVVGSEEAKIDGRSSLAKSKPEEAETNQASEQPFIFQWMNGSG